MWRQRDGVHLDEDAGLPPWLLGTAINLLRRRHRDRSAVVRLVTRLPVDARSEDHADDVAADLDDMAGLRRLSRILRNLADRDREVVYLGVIEG